MSKRSKAAKAKKGKGFNWLDKLIIGVVLVVVIGVAYTLSQPQTQPTTTQTSGAPDFTLPVVTANGLTGERVSLSSFRGKVILLEFMVPWCGHCQNMAPALENLYKQFGPQNVVFLSVSGSWTGPDGRPANADDAAKFIRDYGSTWTYVYDSSNSVFNSYHVSGTPTFFIISKDGSIAATYSGEVAAETLAADITRLNA